MWYEVIIGGLVGLATYMYLHYLNKAKIREELRQKVEQQAARNATELATGEETMEWFNFFLKHWYLTVDEKFQEKIKSVVQPALDDLQLPSPLTKVVLESISFGQNPPYIEDAKAEREKWSDNPNLQTLELLFGPRIESEEFEVRLSVQGLPGIGNQVIMQGFQFSGELQVTILMDKTLPFPCIKHVFFTFTERPDIKFDLSVGGIATDVLPTVKNTLMGMIEEIISDTLVDPGRYLIDMSKPQLEMTLITGVRKLMRTALNITVEISQCKTNGQSEKNRDILCILNTGGQDFESKVEFYRAKETHHIWYPLAVLQEEIQLSVYNVRFGKDDKLAEMKIDVNSLVRGKTKELSRSILNEFNILLVVKATAIELPYIPIRQSGTKVTDFSPYFKIPCLTKADVMMCKSGLVYIHIHRATGLPVKDTMTRSSDPYCKVKVNGEKLFETQVVYASLEPVFNFFEDFFVRNIIETDLSIKLYDKDSLLSADDKIGKVRIYLKDVTPMLVDQGFDIITENGKKAGLLYITIIFRPIPFPPESAHESNSLHNNLGAITVL